MREIKFRFYDPIDKCMMTSGMEVDFTGNLCVFMGNNECPIMQYTGLKDKNGVEIYESDYLSNGEYEYIVEWDNENLCWNGRNVSVPTRSALNWHDEEISVWGNIYQNP